MVSRNKQDFTERSSADPLETFFLMEDELCGLNWMRLQGDCALFRINNLCKSAIQSEEIIFILRIWQRGSLSEHNDSKSWRIDSKLWCHERQVHFLLKRETSTRTAPRTRAFINLRGDRHACGRFH